jgi:hypothetical protein
MSWCVWTAVEVKHPRQDGGCKLPVMNPVSLDCSDVIASDVCEAILKLLGDCRCRQADGSQ